jgi:hypothetical protein
MSRSGGENLSQRDIYRQGQVEQPSVRSQIPESRRHNLYQQALQYDAEQNQLRVTNRIMEQASQLNGGRPPLADHLRQAYNELSSIDRRYYWQKEANTQVSPRYYVTNHIMGRVSQLNGGRPPPCRSSSSGLQWACSWKPATILARKIATGNYASRKQKSRCTNSIYKPYRMA